MATEQQASMTWVMTLKWHSTNRVCKHSWWMDQSMPRRHAGETRERDIVVQATQRPVLTPTAAAALLQILLRASTSDDTETPISADRRLQS